MKVPYLSNIVNIPPVGISAKTMREDPTINEHVWGFSDDLQQWIKITSTSNGGIILSASDFYQDNITSAYTYDSSGNVLTELAYRSDMTINGAPAKLITYLYNSNNLVTKLISDTT